MERHRAVSYSILAGLLVFTLAPRADACSAILLQLAGRPMMARNYDWHIGNALVMMNQPGIAKRALSFDNAAEWVSEYGSVTVNQYGRELPCDGINESGLAIAILWLSESEYPATDERPSVNTAQWVQYQLDTAATVAEVIASDNKIRITPYGGAKVHYFVCDATGDCAVIEFLDGRMVAHRGQDLPQPQITNNTCELSRKHLVGFEGFGGEQQIPSDGASLSRFVRLAAAATEAPAEVDDAHLVALETIHKVRQPSTQWQIAYDLENKAMVFRTRENQAVRRIDLTDCEFGSDKPIQVLDIRTPVEGDVVSEFRNYTREANRRLIERSMAATDFTRNWPTSLVRLVIDYPDVACRPVSSRARVGR